MAKVYEQTANYVALDIVFLLVRMTYDVENIPSLIRALDSNKRYHGNDETDTFSSSIFFSSKSILLKEKQ